ncbi:MAG: PKD domain-containing protein [Planctomycetaceae bacterium]|nr:PKD domain-containing protein [Planctomycetaceae bacterium]
MTAAGSTDPGNDIALYKWDLDGDGTFEKSGKVVAFTSDLPGTHEVTVRVVDTEGASDDAVAQVTVAQGEPTIPPQSPPTAAGRATWPSCTTRPAMTSSWRERITGSCPATDSASKPLTSWSTTATRRPKTAATMWPTWRTRPARTSSSSTGPSQTISSARCTVAAINSIGPRISSGLWPP